MANELNQCLAHQLVRVKYGEKIQNSSTHWKANLSFIPCQLVCHFIFVKCGLPADENIGNFSRMQTNVLYMWNQSKFSCEIKMQLDLNVCCDLFRLSHTFWADLSLHQILQSNSPFNTKTSKILFFASRNLRSIVLILRFSLSHRMCWQLVDIRHLSELWRISAFPKRIKYNWFRVCVCVCFWFLQNSLTECIAFSFCVNCRLSEITFVVNAMHSL